MRLTLSMAAAFMLTACASLPQDNRPDAGQLAAIDGATPGLIAAAQTGHLNASQQAQLRDIREAEARVDLARARLDLATVRNRGAEDGDVREFLDARRALRDVRNVYGPTDTGRHELLLSRYYRPYWPRRQTDGYWTGDPVGTFGLQRNSVDIKGGGRQLSGLAGNN